MLNEKSVNLLIETRKILHANPEVSGQEFETQKRIIEFLSAHCNTGIHKISGTGVLAVFDSGKPGRTVMIRGDIDALRITEVNKFKHRSSVDGISHKCGHDGHTTILLGLAMQLTEFPVNRGKVILLFQPAEETGMGAQSVLNDKMFSTHSIDFVFALHNLPGFKKNEIIVREDKFSADVRSIIIKLHGKTSHSAEPEKGYNPAIVIADIIRFAEENSHNVPGDDNFFLVTPAYAILGEKAYGVSAGYGELHLTMRSWSPGLMKEKIIKLEDFIGQKCRQHTIKPDISWTEVFHACINHPQAVDIIKKAAEANKLDITKPDTPFKWGEDFGLFTQKQDGAIFGLGAGTGTPALHNPDYDFPDDIIQAGVSMFYQIVQKSI